MSDRCTCCGEVPNPDGQCACDRHEHQTSRPMVEVKPMAVVTVHDQLTWAYQMINEAISRTDGGRKCDLPMWSNLQDCRRHIETAMQMIRDGRKAL